VEKAAVSLNRPGLAPQNVQLAQLLLDRVNPFCADGICGSLFRADQRRPSNIGHWHNAIDNPCAGQSSNSLILS
jgi:hypothetical protein